MPSLVVSTSASLEPILRPRLLARLAERFNHRLTTIEAGAGFGKTTLLEQAIAENQLQPSGRDLLFCCRPSDRFEESLEERLRELISAKDQRPAAEAIRDFIWQSSPNHVALILDDVHELLAGSSGLDLVDEILKELPANGHLVLSGRSPLAVSVGRSRMRMQSELLELTEADLAFDSDEVGRFELSRQSSAALTEAGIGWPALLELRARAGGGTSDDKLLDELLATLDPDRRNALARLARLEVVDDAAVLLLTECTESAVELTAGLPLIQVRGDGSVKIHGLWRPALMRLPGAREAAALAAAAQYLREADEIEAALTILLEIRDTSAVRALLRDLVAGRSRLFGSEVLRSFLSQLPPEIARSREAALLDGLTLLRSDPERALPGLIHATELSREAGDREAEVRSLVAQGHVAYYQGNFTRLFELGAYGREIADLGYPDAMPMALVADACAALVRTEPAEALALIDRARSIATIEGVPDFMVATLASLDAGQPERAVVEVERALAFVVPETRGALEMTGLSARWQCGNASISDLETIRPWLSSDTNDSVHSLAVNLGLLTQIAASLGAASLAREFASECQQYLERSFGGRAEITYALGQASIAVLEGDEKRARTLLEERFEAGCLEGKPSRHVLRGLALFYHLVPESRPAIDALPLAPAWEIGRALGRALVATREQNDPTLAAELDWQRSERMTLFLVPPLQTELYVSALASGASLPIRDEDVRVETRNWLRLVSEQSGGSIRTEAKRLLNELPIPPLQKIEIRLLGSLELRRGDVLIDSADWRRSRVRALLLYLIAHPGCRREEVGAALWPEHDTASTTNNLRVNLYHLIRVLQPERKGNEASWFIKQQDARLWLVRDEFLQVDVGEFEATCERGWRAHSDGAPALALECFLEAIERYRGDYCVEGADTIWGATEKNRLQSLFLRVALRAGELLLARDENEQVIQISHRILEIDDLHEPGARLQALASLSGKDQVGARRVVEELIQRLGADGLEPTEETLRLARELGLSGA
ncbi:MAG: BTAD domain-containing putative transcriptional regulator [Myxococcota bacterium]